VDRTCLLTPLFLLIHNNLGAKVIIFFEFHSLNQAKVIGRSDIFAKNSRHSAFCFDLGQEKI
jgi:hypothetical protein